jgi:hypothetical protein
MDGNVVSLNILWRSSPENPSRSTVAKALNARSTTPGFDKAFDELLDEELIKKTPLDLTKHSLTSKGEASFK